MQEWEERDEVTVLGRLTMNFIYSLFLCDLPPPFRLNFWVKPSIIVSEPILSLSLKIFLKMR